MEGADHMWSDLFYVVFPKDVALCGDAPLCEMTLNIACVRPSFVVPQLLVGVLVHLGLEQAGEDHRDELSQAR